MRSSRAALVGLLISLGLPKMVETAQPQLLEATVGEVLTEVQKAMVDTQTRLAKGSLPQLESVVLSLQSIVTKQVGGQIKFLIFSFGRKWEKERSQLVELKLVPPEPSAELAGVPSISEQLVRCHCNGCGGRQRS